MRQALPCLLALTAGNSFAAEDRITAAIDQTRTVALRGHVRPEAQPRYDRGLADPRCRSVTQPCC